MVRPLPSLKLTAKAPENVWLEDEFPFGIAQPGRCELLVSGSAKEDRIGLPPSFPDSSETYVNKKHEKKSSHAGVMKLQVFTG